MTARRIDSAALRRVIQLQSRIAAALQLHAAVNGECLECEVTHPCPTARALDPEGRTT